MNIAAERKDRAFGWGGVPRSSAIPIALLLSEQRLASTVEAD